MNFERIPSELKSFPQWIVWKLAPRDDGKFTKLPYNPKTGRLASVTGRIDWATYNEAVTTFLQGGYSGIGFVLTNEDPYTFIDLDDTTGRANAVELLEWHKQIEASFDSYSEFSPSGKGIHIIVRGRVPNGRRRHNVEIYSTERYMTVTGECYRDALIADRQPGVDWLYGELAAKDAGVSAYVGYEADKEPDDAVLQRALNAANGERFQKLWEGRFEDAAFTSQSEADFALVDMLQFFTSSRQQIRRLFMASGLGQRDKASRAGYVEGMIARSFDRQPKEIDIEAMTASLDAQRNREAEAQVRAQFDAATFNQVKAQVVAELDAEDEYFNGPKPVKGKPVELGPSPYTTPLPGLLGAIAWYIYSAAPRPVPEIAVAGALGLVAGIAGRCFNVSSTGLNVYILLLAKTGRGKEAIASGLGKLMGPVKAIDGNGGGVPGADEFLGPQEIASGQALIKYLSKTSRSFVSIISEFDGFMASLVSRNAPPSTVKLKQILLSAYSRSGRGQRLDKSIYSESEKNVAVIPSPAVTIVGEGTPERFYELLSEELVGDGFLPRFSVIEYEGPRPDLNAAFSRVEPDAGLVQAVAKLCAHCLSLNAKEQVIDIPFTADAKDALDRFNRECDKRINQSESNNAICQLWNRGHIKAMKFAGLIAVGVNWYTPVVDIVAAEWAIAAARHDIERLTARFENGNIGIESQDMRQIRDIKRKLLKLFDGRTVAMDRYRLSREALAAGIFNSLYLQSAVGNLTSFKDDRRGSTAAYHALMQSLTRMGVIDELSRADKDRLGIIGTGYVVKSWDWLKS